jgi:hypothetical protein
MAPKVILNNLKLLKVTCGEITHNNKKIAKNNLE